MQVSTMGNIERCRIFGLLFVITHSTQDDTTTAPAGGGITNIVTTPVKVSKCCPENQNLDLTNPTQPVCVETDAAVSPFVTMKGLDNTRIVDIQLVRNEKDTTGLPSCISDFQVHRIEARGKGRVQKLN